MLREYIFIYDEPLVDHKRETMCSNIALRLLRHLQCDHFVRDLFLKLLGPGSVLMLSMVSKDFLCATYDYVLFEVRGRKDGRRRTCIDLARNFSIGGGATVDYMEFVDRLLRPTWTELYTVHALCSAIELDCEAAFHWIQLRHAVACIQCVANTLSLSTNLAMWRHFVARRDDARSCLKSIAYPRRAAL